MPQGYLSEVADSLKRPSEGMTWVQLAAAVGFILIAAIAWRQVTRFIMREL